MHNDLHWALHLAEQRNRANGPGRPAGTPPRTPRPLRHRLGDALISLGLALRDHPPDPQPAPQRG